MFNWVDRLFGAMNLMRFMTGLWFDYLHHVDRIDDYPCALKVKLTITHALIIMWICACLELFTLAPWKNVILMIGCLEFRFLPRHE